MAITTLDPDTALLVIDLQEGIVGRSLAHPAAGVIRNSRTLADAFRARGLPVVLVNVSAMAPGRTELSKPMTFPPEFAELVPGLGVQPSDLRVAKRTWGAFMHTGLERLLRERGVTGVVLCGIATSRGVESTARQAYELGFNVTLAVDAMTDMSEEAHENSVKRVFPSLGETGTTRQIVERLGGRASA
jgi:nicotinamidase-related amidase